MPLLLALIAILLVGGGAYVYVQKSQVNPPVTGDSTTQVPIVATSAESITVTYPNGGEKLDMNEQDDMPKGINFVTRWTSNNLIGTANVYLISATDGSVCLLGSSPVKQGSFGSVLGVSFKCKNTSKLLTSGQYKVRLIADTQSPSSDLGVNDMSDNYFTLNVVSTNQVTSTAQTANWKTYINSQYEFQISYPQTISLSAIESTVSPGLDVTLKDSNGFQMSVLTRSSEKSLQQYLSDYDSRSVQVGTAMELKINGLEAFQRKENALGPGWDNIATYLKKGNTVLIFVISGRYHYTDKDLDLYNQILTSFKFNSNTSQSKTIIQELVLDDGSYVQLTSSKPVPESSNISKVFNCNLPEIETMSVSLEFQGKITPLGFIGVPKKTKGDFPVIQNIINHGLENINDSLRWSPLQKLARGFGVVDYSLGKPANLSGLPPLDKESCYLKDYKMQFFELDPTTKSLKLKDTGILNHLYTSLQLFKREIAPGCSPFGCG